MVTPVWNGERFLRDTILSVQRQGDAVLEHIILDAMSTDATPKIITEMNSGQIRHIRESDSGLYDAMNKGISMAKGDIVGIINADDFLSDDAIRAVQEAFSEPTVQYVYSDVNLITEEGESLGLGKSIGATDNPPIFPFGFDWRFYTPFYHQGLFVRAETYRKHGTYDISYKYSADHELMARLISRRLAFRYIETPLATFRMGGLSSGSTEIFREDEAIAIQYGMSAHLARINRIKCVCGRIKQRMMAKLAP
jgi:glycosyltransferase involved in cell wall biosynthesis